MENEVYVPNENGLINTGGSSSGVNVINRDKLLSISVKSGGHDVFVSFESGKLTNAQIDGSLDVSARLSEVERNLIMKTFAEFKAKGGVTDTDLKHLGDLVMNSIAGTVTPKNAAPSIKI